MSCLYCTDDNEILECMDCSGNCCGECIVKCCSCNNNVCPDCYFSCPACGDRTCDSCSRRCTNCQEIECRLCVYQCIDCYNDICNYDKDCFYSYNNNILCYYCMSKCTFCSNLYRRKDEEICESCRYSFCSECSYKLCIVCDKVGDIGEQVIEYLS